MRAIRLPIQFEKKIDQIAKSEDITKTEVIKRALEEYFKGYFSKTTAYQIGEDLFGKYGSGNGSLSKDYKKLVRKKINEKYNR
ncbi:MAG: ribbon-helix-helix domain-containing protein [Spirochaetes bacterium]|jgi:hypothetical protein|nr:ribbon-helix-helix domain-containing protein [Spirochaetota bacterium]